MDDLLREIIRQAPEFGITLKEDNVPNGNQDVEGEVADKLKRAAKIDEVDTITFGLETDDGKIVKVFVKAEDAEKFEKLMADMLGKEDNIEDALNSVANECDIVDVEWPAEDEDESEVDAELDDDGGGVLDQKVYNKANLNKEIDAGTKPAVEHLTFGEQFTSKLNEAAANGYVSSRMRTPSQQLVYQAVLDLGVPEMALDRSPYRGQIVKGLKDMAVELQQNGSMKNALKLFVKRAIAGLEKEAEEERQKKLGKTKAHLARGKFGADKSEESPVSEAVIMESVAGELFWDVLQKLFTALDNTDGNKAATDLMKQSSVKALMTRSQAALSKVVQGTLMTKLQQLQRALDAAAPVAEKPAMAEAMMGTAAVQDFIIRMLHTADETTDKNMATRVLSTTQMKALLNLAKVTTSKLPAAVKSKMAEVLVQLGKATMVGEDLSVTVDKNWETRIFKMFYDTLINSGFHHEELSDKGGFWSLQWENKDGVKVMTSKKDGKLAWESGKDKGNSLESLKAFIKQCCTPVTELERKTFDIQGMDQQDEVGEVKWQVKSTKLGVTFATVGGGVNYEVVDEDLERMIKALSNRESTTVKSVNGSKLVVSPRGRSAVIKIVGSQNRIELNPADVEAVFDAAATVMEAKQLDALMEALGVKVPRTARDWQLYSSMRESTPAASVLGKLLAQKLADAKKASLSEDKLLARAKKIRDEMYKEMDKYTNVGARDTEPETVLVTVIERELDLPEYSLDR